MVPARAPRSPQNGNVTTLRPGPRRKRPERGRIPASISSFVGRAGQITEVSQLLKRVRLLTLTGSSGVGKTRLALRLAEEFQDDSADGVGIVELASVSEPAVVASTVAAYLSVEQRPGQTATQALTEALADRSMLLVIDNCEHLIGPCAELADELLRHCPGLQILATSQQPLGIGGEVVWQVPPLSSPGRSNGPTQADLNEYEAIRLFCERAAAVQPGFNLNKENAPAVAEICQRLDGIPLAIELAASRVKALSPAQIAERLEDRFSLLSKGSRNAPARHSSLQAAVEWSHNLLTQREQVLFRRLSIFAGSWTLEAAENLCARKPVAAGEVLDLVESLVSKSLVIVDAASHPARYRFHYTIHEFAFSRLAETGELEALRRSHAAWCMSLAETAENELLGGEQTVWTQRLQAESDNMRAALEWSLETGRAEIALRLAGALTIYWRVAAQLSEGRGWLEKALELDHEEKAPMSSRAKALWGLAFLSNMTVISKEAAGMLQKSLAISRRSGDITGRARALNMLGFMTIFLKNPESALPLLEESTALARQAGDNWTLATALSNCGRANVFRSEFAAATKCYEECLKVATEAKDKRVVADALVGLGWVSLSAGRLDPAESYLAQALVVARQQHQAYETALALSLMGELERVRGRFEEARELFTECLALTRVADSSQAIAFPFPAARSLLGLGKLAEQRNDNESAQGLFEQALEIATERGIVFLTPAALLGAGRTDLKMGTASAAAGRFKQAQQIAQRSGDKASIASALYEMGEQARHEEHLSESATMHHQALTLRGQIGDRIELAESLLAIGKLAASQENFIKTVQLAGAFVSIRKVCGIANDLGVDLFSTPDLSVAREALSEKEFQAAWDHGVALTIEEALAFASRRRGVRQRPSFGWASLTPAELEVVKLVAQRYGNQEIADRLFISVRTVAAHMYSIFRKLELKNRRELSREAERRENL